ncbi:PHP domain-containing protein [Alkaliphilus peptidifermentans]|uniref:Polymerase/histidinol phosphatase N-terminal domain-containing protein n=1 Tax=Alkaliphilus peptidifermentans DSM 18978 TaxID=1120976 RepID=A0A1G5DP55_9FIRM|nr:PHP domain-containing protein [Alkaliphilus peptidifermentans]SCY16377.1 hypothetical protein SAMN03080606_00967 [Alkaliphilus peptidifermentans DSM 18978]
MKVAYDFHIHSGLSPCSEDDMTPNNVVNMAILKGLDAIAITDHNSTLNVEAFTKVASDKKLIIIPGIEVSTKEEVHLIGLFRSLDEAKVFQGIIDQALPKTKNNAKVFGNQLLYNEKDEVIGEYDRLLFNAISLTVEDVVDEVNRLKGIVIPAHIDRNSFSILSNLGFISPALGLTTVEITSGCDINSIEAKHKYLNKYRKIANSDAHNLEAILERQSFLDVKELSCEEIINVLRNKNFVT